MSQLDTSSSVKTPVLSGQLFPLQKQDIVMSWPAILRFLKGRKGSFMDKWDEDSFYAELLVNPDMWLWVGHSGVEIEGLLLCCFSNTPREKLLWITGVYCDNIRVYLPHHYKLEQWAVMMGADAVVFEGAHPWKRLLRRYGYSTPTAMLKKNLRSLWSH